MEWLFFEVRPKANRVGTGRYCRISRVISGGREVNVVIVAGG